jgi:hypothetical protein
MKQKPRLVVPLGAKGVHRRAKWQHRKMRRTHEPCLVIKGCMLTLAVRLRNAQKIFLDVAENFRNSLPAKEKELFQEFDDPVFMVRELQRHVKAYQTSHKLSIFCKNIERFAAAWAPFFDIVNIFMHSRPDLASLAWGAVRLVFLVRFIVVFIIFEPTLN